MQPINFTQIFQDSLNFIRNRPKIFLTFVAMFLTLQACIVFLIPSLPTIETKGTEPDAINLLAQIDFSTIGIIYLIQQILILFLNSWIILTIHQISQSDNRPFNTALILTTQRFFGVLILNLIILFPIITGLSQAFIAIQKNAPVSLSAIIFILTGLILFIRLNISTVYYITDKENISNSLKKVWFAGKGRNGILFLYALFIYFVIPMLQKFFLVSESYFNLISFFITALLSIFGLIFTYRFCRLFMSY